MKRVVQKVISISKMYKKTMNRMLLLIVLPGTVLLTGCAEDKTSEKMYQQMDMNEAVQRMDEESDFIIVDVRTVEEYKNGHIPDAICIPNESIGTKPPKELTDFDQLIFVYCRSGNRSKQASSKLAEIGYTNIVEIGGIGGWSGDLEKGK